MAEDTALVDDRLATHNEKGEITGIDDRAMVSVAVKAIKELKLKVDDLSSQRIRFFGNRNGRVVFMDFEQVFRHRYNVRQDKIGAKNLCARKSDGSEVCVDGDQLQDLLDKGGIAQSSLVLFQQFIRLVRTDNGCRF